MPGSDDPIEQHQRRRKTDRIDDVLGGSDEQENPPLTFRRAHAKMLLAHDRSLYGFRDEDGKRHAGVVDVANSIAGLTPYARRIGLAIVTLLVLDTLHNLFGVDWPSIARFLSSL